jgi:hypothetical protein
MDENIRTRLGLTDKVGDEIIPVQILSKNNFFSFKKLALAHMCSHRYAVLRTSILMFPCSFTQISPRQKIYKTA